MPAAQSRSKAYKAFAGPNKLAKSPTAFVDIRTSNFSNCIPIAQKI